MQQNSSKREVYSKKKEKHQIDNLTLHLKQLDKEGHLKRKKRVSKRKEILQIRSEINEKETKEHY